MGASSDKWSWLADYINQSSFTWQERFAWWPKQSHKSNQRIWLKRAWYGIKYVYGPEGLAGPVKLERWLTDEEYMWEQLTSAE